MHVVSQQNYSLLYSDAPIVQGSITFFSKLHTQWKGLTKTSTTIVYNSTTYWSAESEVDEISNNKCLKCFQFVINWPFCLFQLKPHPKRSLASCLSGHKPKNKRQTKTSNSGVSSVPQSSQSKTTMNPQLIGQMLFHLWKL